MRHLLFTGYIDLFLQLQNIYIYTEVLNMSKIPKIEKFRGDNSIDFKVWITQFEVHPKALQIANEKRLDFLFCCLEGTV